ncbi:hypothetical protein AUC69_00695 [Methyloceanibacter superfactus]|uniref:Uncharacterized protein n=1 Tax=Methyloceanibacter superfactus TaxID=1774969 RepID=A0A1E3W3P9_9HYPH|nr:hypothetical protein [Methyloceanibacter superfactus]ODS00423.1 hypothetical protein AUC69_00695 [Methyloceanibacter superfactus]
MDQRTVESLLRRLVERVEDSERRYGEALDELHTRLDKLSQTTEAARDTGAPENSDTFDRLHAQVSDLARRLEQDTSTPLDDFERLGKALSGALHGDLESDFDDDGAYPAPEPFGYTPEPSPFAKAAMSGDYSGEPAPDSATRTGYPDFGYGAAESAQPAWREPQTGGTGDLDKRLVEMAQRLEESIGTAMPTGAIEALNTRLDEIGGQLSQALETAPTRDALEHVERQISEMGQQVSRAEQQLGKVAGIEAHLIKLIARLDEKADAPAPQADPAQLEEVANKAAEGAARLVAADTQKTNERLDAMHRDLTAMSDKGRESGDRLVSTLEAVHESLKQLVQQVERGSALQAKPRPPFVERARQADAKSSQPQAKPTMQQPRPSAPAAGGQPAGEAAKAKAPAPVPQSPSIEPAKATAAPQAPAKTEQAAAAPTRERTLRDRLGAAIPDFKETEAETETPPPFGRAKRLASDDEAVDLDAAMPSKRWRASSIRSRLGMGSMRNPMRPTISWRRRAVRRRPRRSGPKDAADAGRPILCGQRRRAAGAPQALLPDHCGRRPSRAERAPTLFAPRLAARAGRARDRADHAGPERGQRRGHDRSRHGRRGPRGRAREVGIVGAEAEHEREPVGQRRERDLGLHRDGQVFRRPRAPDAGQRADPRAAAGFAEAVGHGRDAVGRDLLHRGSVLRPHSCPYCQTGATSAAARGARPASLA